MESMCIVGCWYVGGIERRKIIHVQSPRWRDYPFQDDRIFQHKEDADQRRKELEQTQGFYVLSLRQIKG